MGNCLVCSAAISDTEDFNDALKALVNGTK